MENLSHKIKFYLEANGKTESEFGDGLNGNIQLRNDADGRGDHIAIWNVSGLAKPTDDQLNAFASDATKETNNAAIRGTRKNAYGNIGDQLDLLYKDMLADKGDKTGEWFKAVKKVKDDNPKS